MAWLPGRGEGNQPVQIVDHRLHTCIWTDPPLTQIKLHTWTLAHHLHKSSYTYVHWFSTTHASQTVHMCTSPPFAQVELCSCMLAHCSCSLVLKRPWPSSEPQPRVGDPCLRLILLWLDFLLGNQNNNSKKYRCFCYSFLVSNWSTTFLQRWQSYNCIMVYCYRFIQIF